MDLSVKRPELSPAKQALLERRLRGKSKGPGGAQTIAPRKEKGRAILSFAQQRLWFLDQLEPDTSAYIMTSAFRLTGRLNIAALEQSVNEIIRRHESLRTSFTLSDDEPIQIIAPTLNFGLSNVDLSALPEDRREYEVARSAEGEIRRTFDLSQLPLLRVNLFRLGKFEHVIVFVIHHIVSDGWSMGLLIRELKSLYESFSDGTESRLAELVIQYADFAVWQRDWLKGDVLDAQLAYWKETLKDAPDVAGLPTDRPRPSAQGFSGASRSFALSKSLSESIAAMSLREGVTDFMTLLTAFDTLLYRYIGQPDVVVGTPVASRNRGRVEHLIGFFVNTLVLRADLSADPTFRELLRRVKEVTLSAYEHQDLPFEILVEELQPQRDLNRTPLAQVIFVLHNTPNQALKLSGLTLSPIEFGNPATRFDLELHIFKDEEGFRGSMIYSTDLFDEATVARAMIHFETLLEDAVAHPDEPISRLSLLTSAEAEQLLSGWNSTDSIYLRDACIHNLFEHHAAQSPDAVAVVFEGEHLTYRALNLRANQLAHHLISLGVGPDVMVGICMERTIQMIVVMMGILKAGGAYVPLDPAYPVERLDFMLKDARALALITQRDLIEALPARPPEHAEKIICVDEVWEEIAKQDESNVRSAVTGENLAYVIYTSGSTGRPKGVAIEHRSASVFVQWAGQVFKPEYLKAVLASTSICFDLSIFEVFAPLSYGGAVILVKNALQLEQMKDGYDVTLINTVPSAIRELIRIEGVPESVRVVNLAGEPLNRKLVDELYDRRGVEAVWNLYGPTEDTTYTTYALMKKDSQLNPSIGRPIANTQVYVLDWQKYPVPLGVTGELYIGGDGLARGYLHQPDMTAEKFLPDPFSDRKGARLYRTGDLARLKPDGEIDFLGRIDDQVKIKGYRIEIGEIESALAQHPNVREAVVIAQDFKDGDKRLVAYLAGDKNEQLTDSDLRRFIGQKLPGFMLPSAFVILESLPLTHNGKIDRKALPSQSVRHQQESEYLAPRTPLEWALVRIWASVLDVDQVSINDNFFSAGGHSLLATRVISRLRGALKLEVPLRLIFEKPTVAELAAALEELLLETIERLSEAEAEAMLKRYMAIA